MGSVISNHIPATVPDRLPYAALITTAFATMAYLSPSPRIDLTLRLSRFLECTALFVLVPCFIDFANRTVQRSTLPIIWLSAALCYFLLRGDPTFEGEELWGYQRAVSALPGIFRRAAVIAPGMLLLTMAIDRGWVVLPGPRPPRGLLFAFAREVPKMYAVVMIGYPLFSVYPQEVVFRVFFVHRYGVLFTDETWMLLANAIAFGWAHVIFKNAVAVPMCIVGGVQFAATYVASRSALAVAFEHALLGDVLLTVGLFWFFYHGNVAVAASGKK